MKPFLTVVALSLLVCACGSRRDRSALLKGIAVKEMNLECRKTDAPDLSMHILLGFQSEWTRDAQFDKFFIYDPGDTGIAQKGMILLDVSPHPAIIIDGEYDVTKFSGVLAGQPVTWSERTVIDADGNKLYQREAVEKDMLKSLFDRATGTSLKLHAFIVGTDTMLVERLSACTETMKYLSPKTNL